MITDEIVGKAAVGPRYDKWLFFATFSIGTIAILAAKIADLRPAIPVAIGVLAIATYGLIAWRSPAFRLREDRAGDGAYYLGFLFTLVSLSFALWEFENGKYAHDVDAVIRN